VAASDDLSRYYERTRTKGVNKAIFWTVRVIVGALIQAYFSLERNGRRNIPKKGPVILASNHRSFLDPFVIGCCVHRPVYFVAKKELFGKRWQGWILNRLGAFPVKRGESDEESMATARGVLERGGAIVIFPEGTRHRTGPLGRPKRGVGRLALETGAPVVPIAVMGSERARRGWRIRPVWVRVRCGKPLRFPRVENPSPRLAEEVTARLWPCVELQWNWLGGDHVDQVHAEPERKAA
jgi:1-acyl-sn-glycerol-3-phosphate acyltransferase